MTLLASISERDMEKQIAYLSKELAGLKKSLSRRGSEYYGDGREGLSDYYAVMADKISDGLPALGKRARAVESSVRDNPAATAAAGLAALGLFAMFLFSRR